MIITIDSRSASTTSTESTSSTSSTTSVSSTTSETTSTTTTASTTTTTTPTTTPSCGTTNPSFTGLIDSISPNPSLITYTLNTYGFTATSSSATLTFALMGDGGGFNNYYFLLDSISVINTNTSTNVLINGGFETGDFTGWTQYCNTNVNCNTGDYGQLTTSPCYSGTYCYMDRCANYDYLVQSFSTVIGDYYLISFYIRVYSSGGNARVYVALT